MNSAQRRENRYQRRAARREAKRKAACAGADNFEEVFSYEHLYRSYQKCRRNVAWKASVQKYITQAPLLVRQTRERLLQNKFRSGGFYEFDLNERGKLRHIKAVAIGERVVQRCLCDYALAPVLERGFIYDNAASRKGKGYHFALRRLTQHLREHFRKHGTEGYVLLFDFRKFFEGISHKLCKSALRQAFSDEQILALIEYFIDCFGEAGLGLGSQISQTLALASANRLDHYIKEVCRIRGYGRYMDDGYLIHRQKAYLQQCLQGIREICRILEITLNEKKTQIVKLSHGFTFLKAKFYLLPTGKVLRKIPRQSVTRERRKLKSFVRLMESGVMTYEDIYTSFQSWRAYANHFSAWHTVLNMGNLYDRLFVDPWIYRWQEFPYT